MGIWLAAVTFLVGVPVALAMGGDYRHAKAMGIANPAAVIRSRFFIPRRPSAVATDAIGRHVWLDCWRLGCTMKVAGQVVEVIDATIIIDAAGRRITFRPARQSAFFASGRGAATGAISHDDRAGYGMLVFTGSDAPR